MAAAPGDASEGASMTAVTDLLTAVHSGHGLARPRTRAVVAGLVALLVVAAIGALTMGSSNLSTQETLGALIGRGDQGSVFVVRELRLPRVLVAIAVGTGLGASGVLLQGLLRNPLGSPDVMGVTAGASLAAVVAIGAEIDPLLLPAAAACGQVRQQFS